MQCATYWCIYAPLLTEGIFGEIPASDSYLDEGPDRCPATFGKWSSGVQSFMLWRCQGRETRKGTDRLADLRNVTVAAANRQASVPPKHGSEKNPGLLFF